MGNVRRRLAGGEAAVDFRTLKMLARCARPGHARIPAARPYKMLNKFLRAIFLLPPVGLFVKTIRLFL